jgi:hypothetical protein
MTNFKVGYQTDITDKDCPVKSVSFYDALRLMEIDEKLKQSTERIRKAKTKDDRDKLKKSLPAIIVSADTTCRKAGDEDIRNPLIYIDLDLDDNPEVFSAGVNGGTGYAAFSVEYLQEMDGSNSYEDYVSYVRRPRSYLDTGCVAAFVHRQRQKDRTPYSVHIWQDVSVVTPGVKEVFTAREGREAGLYFKK